MTTLIYEPETGLFYRDFKKGKKLIPGATNSDGYKHYKEGGKVVAGQILAFRCMGIEIPPGMEVDHLDRIKSNNKWENLKLKTHQGNMMNMSQRREEYALGVNILPSGRYRVRVCNKSAGSYDTLAEANRVSVRLRTEPDV